MMKRKRGIFIILCFLTLFQSCERFSTTDISELLQKPRDYAGKQVIISGTVIDAFSLVVVKYFVVGDGTAEITVVTEKPLPKKGEKIKVHGILREAFSIGEKQLVVLLENTPKK